jgi:Na+-driven multidrug efflux pump
MVYAHEFVTLYVGSVYEQAAPVMRLSLLMFPIAYGNTMFVYICEAKANNRLFAIRFLVMNVINLILTLIFVIGFRFGAIGSALATACSFAVVYPLSMWPTGRRLVGVDGATWFRRTIVPGLLPGIASGLVMVSLKLFVTPETWFSLLTCATAGAATYLVVLLRSCLGEDDKADILRVVHSLPFGEPIATSCIRRLLGPRGDRLQ